MSKEMREQTNKVKNFKQFINEDTNNEETFTKKIVEKLETLRLYFVINVLKFKKCKHKFVTVNITPDMIDDCKKIYSHTNAKIYNKFIIPNDNTYQKCITCGKIKF